MKSKKVLFVATVVKKHINVFHLPYLQWFQEQGYETHVAARDDFNGEECIIPHCDKHFDIPFERSPLNKNNITAYTQLKKIINENNYDIIHCHTPVAAMLTRFAARKARKQGTKVIYTAHGFHFFKGAPLINWLIYFPVEWICSFLTDILITINREDYQLAKKAMRTKTIKYVPGVGLDIVNLENIEIERNKKRKEIGVPKDSILLFSVGELNNNKNHKVIIEALKRLDNPMIHYCIAGQGELETKLKNLAARLGVQKQVHFLGFRSDVIELYSISDIFCFPSYREGLSLSLMEAMSVGLPVVCSNIRGNKDLITSNGGFLCNPNNINEFYDAILELIQSQEQRVSMSLNNKNNIRQYTLDRVLEIMKRIYST